MSAPDIVRVVLLALASGIIAYGMTGMASDGLWLTDKVKARSNHRRPASRAGGIVVLGTVFFMMGLVWLMGWAPVPGIAGAALVAGLLGALDDAADVPARIKFAALLVLCAFVAAIAGPVPGIPLPLGGAVDLPPDVGYFVSAAFLFGFLNAFNFMDGLNGMAGGAGIIGLALVIAVTSPAAGGVIMTCLIAAAALYGFVIRNLLKGGIFLGDAGSLGLSMLLGAGALGASQDRVSAIWIFAVGFAPFILDVAVTLVRRARRGEQLLDAHKEHMYQRLRADGWSHQAVSASYAGMILASSVAAVLAEAQWGSVGLWAAGGFSAVLTVAVWAGMSGGRLSSAGQQS